MKFNRIYCGDCREFMDNISRKGDLIVDPFCGSGTILKVAKELGRNYIGIEISQEYVGIANKRLAQEVFNLTKQEG